MVYIIYAQCIHCQLAKNEKDEHLHYLVDLDLTFLPPLPEQEEDNIDVGQDDFFKLELYIFIPLSCNIFILYVSIIIIKNVRVRSV